MQIKAERGYVIPAIGEAYHRCADLLMETLKHWHPGADVTIITEHDLPYGDRGGQANDWQMFYASPYRQTIKLEADMIVSGPVDHWWTLFENRDVVISQGCRDIYDQPAHSRYYRKIFDDNSLPDVYNAVTYWRMSQTAKRFFSLVRHIFENWQDYQKVLKYPDECPTTDVVYGVAAVIIGTEEVTLPLGFGPSIVHMKKHIIPLRRDDWTKEMVWEYIDGVLRVNTVAQTGFVHYYIKDWAPNG